jgi:hypothetical protein
LSVGCKNPFVNILFRSQVRVSKPQPGVLKKKVTLAFSLEKLPR